MCCTNEIKFKLTSAYNCRHFNIHEQDKGHASGVEHENVFNIGAWLICIFVTGTHTSVVQMR